MSRRPVECMGDRYGHCVVIGDAEPVRESSGRWRRCVSYRCDCGITGVTRLTSLRSGRAKSCGCLRRKPYSGTRPLPTYNRTHGHSSRLEGPTPTYRSWSGMIQRCTNPKRPFYRIYGARGIKVCERWLVFENFLADMGERPEGATLDRINPNGNYEPENCRWATTLEQANNTRRNRVVRDGAQSHTMAEWARSLGLSYMQFYHLHRRHNLSIQEIREHLQNQKGVTA